jgi:hypothetical protein
LQKSRKKTKQQLIDKKHEYMGAVNRLVRELLIENTSIWVQDSRALNAQRKNRSRYIQVLPAVLLPK